jgi:hypothetical protein
MTCEFSNSRLQNLSYVWSIIRHTGRAYRGFNRCLLSASPSWSIDISAHDTNRTVLGRAERRALQCAHVSKSIPALLTACDSSASTQFAQEWRPEPRRSAAVRVRV